ncbi:MAG TPA: T9SS type A sorting domain-containing protein [Candidatus Kapabacteria bacterium]|nr:T9SS type A sorting domain-containing protein [Candidatus Kapabacteria bacterium]
MKKYYKISLLIVIGVLLFQTLKSQEKLLGSLNNSIEFIENRGQVTDDKGNKIDDILFVSKNTEYPFYLRQNGISFILSKTEVDTKESKYRMDLDFEGINRNLKIIPKQKLSHYYNFYNNSNKNGITKVAAYKEVAIENIFDGVDFVIYENINKQLEYDFIVKPNSDIKNIKFELRTDDKLEVSKDGKLLIKNELGTIEKLIPYSYQIINGEKVKINSNYKIQGNKISFEVGNYDKSTPLIIDPILLSWGTYYGGTLNDLAADVGVDVSNNIYVTGKTRSTTYVATSGAYQTSLAGGWDYDCFIAKFNASGSLLWATYFGGDSFDEAKKIAVQSDGNFFITGITHGNFENVFATPGTHQQFNNGAINPVNPGYDAFLTKFNTEGQRVWSTYYGGTGYDFGNSIALDGSGNIYLGGLTQSTQNIASAGAFKTAFSGNNDVFFAKMNSQGQRIWGTYYGSGGNDSLGGITFNNNMIYLTGGTNSQSGIATWGCWLYDFQGVMDIFVAKFNQDCQQMWSTYYGGSSYDIANDIQFLSSGEIIIAGATESTTNIASSGSSQGALAGGRDGFIARFNQDGNRVWATYLGGTAFDNIYRIYIDNNNGFAVTGETFSNSAFATANSYQTTNAGGSDAFITHYTVQGIKDWGSFYGGTNNEIGLGIAYDNTQNYILVGSTLSTNQIATNGSYQTIKRGTGDAFVSKFYLSYSNIITTTPFSGAYCSGSSFNVSYSVNEPFFAGNVFTAQLSDANGNFTNPVNIGTLSSLTSGTINVTIPLNTISGTNYRIRVIGSNPYIIGSNNGNNLSIQQKPVPVITGDTLVRCSKVYTYYGNKDVNYSYQWSITGGYIQGNNTYDSVKVVWNCVSNGTIKLVINNLAACSDSTTLAITITNVSAPDIYGNSIVFTNSTNQYYTDSTEQYNYVWSAVGGNIVGPNILKNVSVKWGTIGTGILKLKRSNNLGLSDSALFNVKISDFAFQFPLNPNDKLTLCSENEITWSPSNLDSLIFSYSIDNGITFNYVATVHSGDGSYLWSVPNVGAINSILLKMADKLKPNEFYKTQSVGINQPNVTIIKPVVNEYIKAGSDYTIKWNAQNCDSVEIWFRPDATTPWVYLSKVAAADSVYKWTVPNVPANTYQLKLSVSNDCYSAVSSEFRITSKFVEMLYPVGGEQLGLCRFPYTLEFATNSVATVNILIKNVDSTNWVAIAQNIAAGTGTFQWNWTNAPEVGFYLMKIEDANEPEFFSISEESFEITDACVNLISPNGGEIWEVGTLQNIAWQSTATTFVKLEYTIDNINWFLIKDSVPAVPSSYPWIVPTNPSENVRVRVSVSGKPNINDISDAAFKVYGIKVNYPNGNESFLISAQTNITWNSAGVNNVKIQFSTDNGTNWSILTSSYPANSKSYGWTIPNTPSNQCLIKITDVLKSSLTDQSDSTFKISGVVVLSPVGGEKLLVATTHQIKWNSQQVSNVKIQYSTNSGQSWITIISSTPAAAGTYDWLVPKTVSYQCKIKISDVNDSTNYDISSNVFRITGNGIILNYPEGKEVFLVNQNVEIKWNSINILNVKIEYSTNAGISWNTIISNLPAEEYSYMWTVPNTPSTEGIIRITDVDNSSITDENMYYFRIKGNVYPPPSTWYFTDETGYNSIILVPDTSYIDIAGREIMIGDAIGAFFPSGTDMICAGYAIWDGENLTITVWGDNPRSAVKDGFNLTEKYTLRVWDGQEGNEHPADVVFNAPPIGSTGPADEYHHDNISIIGDIRSSAYLRASMKGCAYRMYSSNLKPVSMSIVDILSDVANNLDIVKDDEANVYLPNPYTNTIGQWNVKKGYQMNMLADDSLIIRGYRVIPNEFERELGALNWYIVSYLPYGQMFIEEALQSINENILVVKNSDGKVYYPQFGINKIEVMNPGEGYKLIVKALDTLLYPSGPLIIAPNKIIEDNPISAVKTNSSKYAPLYQFTDNNAVLIIESTELKDGDEIAVINSNNQIVGADVFENGKAALTIWGDDKSTKSVVEGAKENEVLKLILWNIEDNNEYSLKSNNIVDLIASKSIENITFYQDALILAQVSIDGILSVSDISKDELQLYNQPNPFNEKTDIIFYMENAGNSTIEIYNEMGIKVATSFDGFAKAGMNKITFNSNDLSNGVYFCKMKTSTNQLVHKLMIVK